MTPPTSTAPERPIVTDFKIKDIALADFGRKELLIAEKEMPGLMALRADRTWTDADQHALSALKAAHPHPILLVLTEMNRDFLNGLTARGLPIPPFLRPIFG